MLVGRLLKVGLGQHCDNILTGHNDGNPDVKGFAGIKSQGYITHNNVIT